MSDRRTDVRRPPAAPAGLGPRPRLPQRTTNSGVTDRVRRESVHEETVDTVEGPDRPWRSLALMGISVIGIGIAIYTAVLHYAHVAPVCTSGVFNCERVLTSPQSVLLGIPLPVYGLLFFIAMFVASLPRIWHTTLWWVPWVRLGMSSIGILFALRLIYEEVYVIRSLCLWCTGVHILSFVMFIIIVTGWEDATKNVVPRGAS